VGGVETEFMRSKDDSWSAEAAEGDPSHKFVRVALPDGSTTVIYAKPSTTLRAAIAKLCERRNLDTNMVDVYSHLNHKVRALSNLQSIVIIGRSIYV